MNKTQYAEYVGSLIKKGVNESDKRIYYLFSNFNI